MSNDITLKPKLENVGDFGEAIEDVEILFKTQKGAFIGTFNSWNITLNLNNNSVEIPNSIKPLFKINEKQIKMPTFLLTPKSDEETTKEADVKGYDKSILFDEPFEWTQTLPCTAGELAQNICSKVGVPLKDLNFANSDFVIYRQIADSKRTNREVIAMIAAAAGGNAFINENDELEIRSFMELDIDVQEYFSSEKFMKIGPITGVNIAREPIKDYKELNDAALSAQYKSCMVKIVNNLIVDDNRELALQDIYDKLHGLEFYCKKIETHEAFFTKPFSFVQCNEHKVLADTICLKYPTLIDSYISSNQLTEVESTAKNKSLKQRVRNAEAKVDEVEGKINLLTSEVLEHEDKIAGLEVNVNAITTKVENIADLTREVSGSTKIQLDDCMQGGLLELHIYGNNTVFERLLPRKNLYPSKTLYPNSFGKIVINKIDVKNRFEKKFGPRYITVKVEGYDSVNHIVKKYQGLAIKDNEDNNRYYILKLEHGKTYDIILDKNEISDEKWLYLETFEKNPFETDAEDRINAVKYYGLNEYVYENGVSNWKINTEKDHITITPTEQEKFLIFYCYDVSTFNTAQIYENYNERKEIELTQIKQGLKQFGDVCDELVLANNQLQVIRRVGADEEGNKYVLENEIIENLGELEIPLNKGTNYIEISNYIANLKAKYVVVNDFTKSFATTAELKSSLKLMADSITSEVNQKFTGYSTTTEMNNIIEQKVIDKENSILIAVENTYTTKDSMKDVVKEDSIVAKINLAVKNKQGVIDIESNQFKLKSDNTSIDTDGTLTTKKIIAKGGQVAGLVLEENDQYEGSFLYKEFSNNGNDYSGLLVPNGPARQNVYRPFLFAGASDAYASDLGSINTYITHEGLMKAKWLTVDAEDGYFYTEYSNGKKAMQLDTLSLNWRLNNNNNGLFASIARGSTHLETRIGDSRGWFVWDSTHKKNIFEIDRYAPELSDTDLKAGSRVIMSTTMYVQGNREGDNISNTIYIQGYEVTTTASDERLKANKKKCIESGLEVIDEIPIISFDWKRRINTRNAGEHVRFGYGAQSTEDKFKDGVIHNEEFDTYQMNLLNLSALHTKSIQELNAKINNLEKLLGVQNGR